MTNQIYKQFVGNYQSLMSKVETVLKKRGIDSNELRTADFYENMVVVYFNDGTTKSLSSTYFYS